MSRDRHRYADFDRMAVVGDFSPARIERGRTVAELANEPAAVVEPEIPL